MHTLVLRNCKKDQPKNPTLLQCSYPMLKQNSTCQRTDEPAKNDRKLIWYVFCRHFWYKSDISSINPLLSQLTLTKVLRFKTSAFLQQFFQNYNTAARKARHAQENETDTPSTLPASVVLQNYYHMKISSLSN